MKPNKKIILSLASIPVTTLIFPVLAVRLAPADAGMAISLLLLFVAYPVQSLIIGTLSGANPRRIWWLILCMPAAVPLLFSLAFLEMIWEIWFYSPIYLAAGVAGMAVSVLFGYISARKNKQG